MQQHEQRVLRILLDEFCKALINDILLGIAPNVPLGVQVGKRHTFTGELAIHFPRLDGLNHRLGIPQTADVLAVLTFLKEN
jgi:hypothetical protein